MPTICQARPIKLKTGARVAIGEHIKDVQRIFRPVFNATDVSGITISVGHAYVEGTPPSTAASS
jgi:hypothetical protein